MANARSVLVGTKVGVENPISNTDCFSPCIRNGAAAVTGIGRRVILDPQRLACDAPLKSRHNPCADGRAKIEWIADFNHLLAEFYFVRVRQRQRARLFRHSAHQQQGKIIFVVGSKHKRFALFSVEELCLHMIAVNDDVLIRYDETDILLILRKKKSGPCDLSDVTSTVPATTLPATVEISGFEFISVTASGAAAVNARAVAVI